MQVQGTLMDIWEMKHQAESQKILPKEFPSLKVTETQNKRIFTL